jgi:hypothetical protein
MGIQVTNGENSKSQTLNPKQIPMTKTPNFQSAEFAERTGPKEMIWDLELGILSLFRI